MNDSTSKQPPKSLGQVQRYQEVASYYRNQILAGVLKVGEEMPSRHEIMEQHTKGGKPLGRGTADKVIDVLAAEGLIIRRHRMVPLVADRMPHATNLQTRLASKEATGEALSVNEESRILRNEMTTCPTDIAPFLGVEAGAMVLIRSRVNMLDGSPRTTSTSYYTEETARVTPELAEGVSIRGGSRELAAERLGGTLGVATEYVTSRLASDAERSTLLLPGTFSVVTQAVRVCPLTDGRIVEVATKVTAGSNPMMFRTDLNPNAKL